MSKILCLIDSLGAGGAERQLAYLATLLKADGHDVMFVAFTRQHKFYEPFLRDGGVIPVYNSPGVNRFRRIWEIAKIVREFKPNLTVAYKDGVCMSAILAKLFGNYNLAVSERSNTPDLSHLQRLKVYLFRYADHIVPNSYAQAANLRRFSPHLASKIKVIVNTVDTDVFHPSKEKIDSEIIEILTTARVKRIKNIINYLRAIAIIKDNGIKCHFNWYGKTDAGDTFPDEVQEEIKRLDIGDYVTFYPATNNVANVYRRSNIFCLPSLIEGFPNAICEAMASGLPVVCSNVCDNPNIVEFGINGFLFNPESPEDIAGKLIAMIQMPESEKKAIANCNRNKITRMCSPRAFVDAYLSLIKCNAASR